MDYINSLNTVFYNYLKSPSKLSLFLECIIKSYQLGNLGTLDVADLSKKINITPENSGLSEVFDSTKSKVTLYSLNQKA